eukprot:6454818-Amphidinium_carterae.1
MSGLYGAAMRCDFAIVANCLAHAMNQTISCVMLKRMRMIHTHRIRIDNFAVRLRGTMLVCWSAHGEKSPNSPQPHQQFRVDTTR